MKKCDYPESDRIQIRTPKLGRVTIITAVFNSAGTLPSCIESVLSQDYPNIEHILIDGGSSDGSIEILKSYGDRVAFWKSEPDKGIYDAWNKALEVATGEWISFLGADDRYLPGSVSAYINAVSGTDAEYISSRVRWSQPGGRSEIIGKCWSWPGFQSYMTTAHVGSMHKYTLYERYGHYDPLYRIVGDYEVLLRPRGSLRARFLPIVTAEMMAGGVSNSSQAIIEARLAKVRTGGRNAVVAYTEMLMAIAMRMLRRRVERFAFLGGR